MTQEKKSDTLFPVKEIAEMFDNGFFDKMQDFTQRVEKEGMVPPDVKHYELHLKVKFSDLKKPLKYKNIQHNIQMQIVPITEEDIKKEKERKENEIIQKKK